MENFCPLFLPIFIDALEKKDRFGGDAGKNRIHRQEKQKCKNGGSSMDLEEQLETQRKETVTALQILLGYADELAAGGLDSNKEKLSDC